MDHGKQMKRQESKEFVLDQIDGPVCLREPVVKSGMKFAKMYSFVFIRNQGRETELQVRIPFEDNARSAIRTGGSANKSKNAF